MTADTSCSFAARVVDELGPTRIKNVSMEGIGLLASKRVEVGCTLTVNIQNKAKSFSKLVLVKVAHVTPHGGAFLIGGTFETPLTYQELTALIM